MPPRSAALAHPARVAALAVPAVVALVLVTGTTASATPAGEKASARARLTNVSHDIYTDAQAQHRTEVEPGAFQAGSTIVAAFQVGRVYGGGASNIGWATSTNRGKTWSHGYLPGITRNAGGRFGQVSDSAVAYDARHRTWLISSLALNLPASDVLVSRSRNGLAWGRPVTVATGFNDKEWIVCDDTRTSPRYGSCYAEYDDINAGEALRMRTSTDGGAVWGPARAPAGNPFGLGGQPVVLPDGNVVVPYESTDGPISSFRSTNGGVSWSKSVVISAIGRHPDAGGLRASPLPTAAVDADGTVYVAWADCRYRPGCGANDVVIAKSTGATTWAAPVRVPINATSSAADDFTPALAVMPGTSGRRARLGLTYYYYPKASCSPSTCRLYAGFISSANGGASWSAPMNLAGPMSLSWLPNTSEGRMFGDYVCTSILANGVAYPVVPVAQAPAGHTFHVAMYVPAGGLRVTGGGRVASAAHAHPVTPRPPTGLLTAR
jgi:hypothetical protein